MIEEEGVGCSLHPVRPKFDSKLSKVRVAGVFESGREILFAVAAVLRAGDPLPSAQNLPGTVVDPVRHAVLHGAGRRHNLHRRARRVATLRHPVQILAAARLFPVLIRGLLWVERGVADGGQDLSGLVVHQDNCSAILHLLIGIGAQLSIDRQIHVPALGIAFKGRHKAVNQTLVVSVQVERLASTNVLERFDRLFRSFRV